MIARLTSMNVTWSRVGEIRRRVRAHKLLDCISVSPKREVWSAFGVVDTVGERRNVSRSQVEPKRGAYLLR